MSLPNLETSFGYRCLDQVTDCKNKMKRIENPPHIQQPKSILKSLQLGKLRQKFLSKINVLPMSFDNEVQDCEPSYCNIDQYDCIIHGDSYQYGDKRQYSKYLMNYDQELSASVPSSPRFLSPLRQSPKASKNTFSEFINDQHYDYDSSYAPPPYHISQPPSFSVPISSPNHSCVSSPFQSPKRILNQRNMSQFYVPTSSIPFQEIREICLLKEKTEKYGFKVEKIGQGIFITHLLPDSPTVKAGLKVGDEIIRLNNLQISDLSNSEMIAQIKAAETCLRVSFKPRLVVMRLRDVIIRKVDGRLGIRLQKRPEGLFLVIVVADSPACRAGLKEGDELLKINNENVADWSQEKVTQYLRDISTDDTDLLLIVREYLPMAHILPGTNTCDSGLDEFNEISTGISESSLPCCSGDKGFNNFT